jgi:hypothetical protein
LGRHRRETKSSVLVVYHSDNTHNHRNKYFIRNSQLGFLTEVNGKEDLLEKEGLMWYTDRPKIYEALQVGSTAMA